MKKLNLLLALLLSFGGATALTAQETVTLEVNKQTGGWSTSSSAAYASEYATSSYSAERVTPGVRIQHWDRSGGHRNNMYFWDGDNLGFYSAIGSTTSEDYRIYPSKGYYISSVSFDFIPGKHPSYAMNGVRVWFEYREDEAVESSDADNPAHFSMDFSEYEATGDDHYLTMTVGQALENGNPIFAHTSNFIVTLTKRDSLEVLLDDIIAFVEEIRPYTLDGGNAFITGTGIGNYGEAEVAAFNAAYAECLQKIDDPTGMGEYDEYKALYDNLKDAYEAVLASQVTLVITDGYYRFRTAMNYNDQTLKYMYATPNEDGTINGKWGTLYNQTDSCMALWQLTEIGDGVWDIVNMATNGRFNANPATLSDGSENRFTLEVVATIDGNTYVDVKYANVETGSMGYVHQAGHASGAGTGGNLTLWYPSYSGTTMGGTEWVIESVNQEEAAALIEAYTPIQEHNQLVREYKALLAESHQFLEESKGTQEEALIDDVDQLSSPWTEESEGSLEALLDGDPATFWHSAWSSGSVENHTHYLQVALNEPAYEPIQLQITRRPTYSDHITQWGVYGSNDADAADEEWAELASLSTPYGSNRETIKSDFFAPQGYQFLRFYIDGTTTNHGFGHVAEFQLLCHVADSSAAYARLGSVATDFEARLLAFSQIAEDDYTWTDLDDLRNAYEAYVQACDELGEDTPEDPDPTPEDPDPTTDRWPKPVPPTMPTRAAFDGNWVTPEAGNTYYIYNVGAAQFMGAGRNWGTRTITTNDSIVSPNNPQVKHIQTSNNTKNFVLPYTLQRVTGKDYFYFVANCIDFSGYVTGLMDGNSSWQDGSDSRAANWQLIEEVNGEFLLHDAVNEPYDPSAYNAEDPDSEENDINKYNLLGVTAVEASGSYTWTDSHPGVTNSGITYKVGWKFLPASDEAAQDIRAWRADSQEATDEEMEAYRAALALYNAKITLRNTMMEAVEVDVDVTAAEAVYLSKTATEADVRAANTSLMLEIKMNEGDFPIDITSVLQNPDFSVATANGVLPPGWDITITGQYCGQMNRTDTNAETGLSITNFIEAWHTSSLGDGVIAQTVYGLPAGVYRLECDASICHDPANGDGSDIVGAGLFIKAGNLRVSTPVGTPRLGVAHFEVEFENDGRNEMQFGLFAESTNANWLSADNFQLYYVGPLTDNPNYKNLQKYLAEIQDKYNNENIGSAYLCQETKDALDDAMNAAAEISQSATDEDIDAAYINLENAYAAVTASITVYQTLLPYTSLNEEGSKLNYYEEATAENGWDELSMILNGLQDDFDIAYEEGSWSDAEVTEHINSIIPTIITWIEQHPAAVVKGNDLTMLLINADFEDGEYNAGWDAKDDEVQPGTDYGTIPGWTISSGNITQMNHVIETYHRKFDFNQTIENLPAGVYDISVQGFVRHDGSATDQTIFYAGDSETQLMQRTDQWSTIALYNPDTMGDPCGGSNGDQTFWNSRGEEVWLPNGMSGFYFWEMVENTDGTTMDYLKWKEGDLYYTNHIRVALNEPGDFIIGLKSLGNTDWIIWDNFRITYIGDDGNVYAEMAAEKFEELNRVYENDNNQMSLTEQAMAEYSEIAIFDYTTINSLDAYQDYSEQCDSLISYIQQGTQLGKALHDLLSEYGEKVNVVTFDTSDFLSGHYSEYSTNLENGTSPDNDYLSNAPDVLAIEWTQCAVKQADTALFNNLGDIIINPKYTTVGGSYTLDGWNMEKEEGVTFGNYLANEGVAEVYNPSGEYKHYQTIKGLSAGYYRVTVDAYFRPGDMKQADGREVCASIPSRALLFAEGGSKTFVTPIKNILVGHDSQEAVGDETTWTWADESVEYTPNNVAAANHYFNNVINWDAEETNLSGEADCQSVYRNAINVHVGEDGVLTIGVTNHGIAETVTNDWACFSNWTLSYMGTERPSDMPEDEEPEEPEGLLGDVNGDGSVDVVDLTRVVDFILEKAVPTVAERKRADVNKDASIDVVDLTTIVSIILETYTPASNVTRAPARRDASVTTDVLTMSGTDISLDNIHSYVACQMDVTLADGATLKGIELSDRARGFSKSYSKIADNTYRVVVYSLGNEPFDGNDGTLLKLNILGDQYSSISNALFTDGHKAYRLEVADIVDGVNGITPSPSKRDVEIFSLSGQKLNRLQKGVNIVNGKKVQVK